MLHWRTRLAMVGLVIAAAIGGLFDGWSWL